MNNNSGLYATLNRGNEKPLEGPAVLYNRIEDGGFFKILVYDDKTASVRKELFY